VTGSETIRALRSKCHYRYIGGRDVAKWIRAVRYFAEKQPNLIDLVAFLLERRDHLMNSDVRTIYQFGLSPVAPVSVQYSSTYDMVHGILESEGQIHRAVSSGPERLDPQAVRMWTPAGGWSNVAIKTVK